MNNNTKNTNITVGRHNLSRTSTLWNNVKQSATTINELTERMSKDFHKPETHEEFTSMNRDVKKILQTAITLKRNMDVITGRLEAAMILRDANKAAADRILSDREDDIAKDEPVKAPESPQNAPEGVETAYTAKMEETPAKPVVEPPKVSQFAPTLAEWNTLLSAVETFVNDVARHLTNITNIDFCTGHLREPAAAPQQSKDDKPEVILLDPTAEWDDFVSELEANITDPTRRLTARDLDVCADPLSEPIVDGMNRRLEKEETPDKPVVEPPKVKTPVVSFVPTAYSDDPDLIALDGLSTMPYTTKVRGVMPSHRYWLLGAIKKVIDTLNDMMKVAATGNPFPARPEDFIHGVYCGFKNVKFTIIKHADWVPEGSTAVAVIVDYENGDFSCHSGRNVVVCDSNLREDVLEYCLNVLAEGVNKLLTMATSHQAK